MISLEEVSAKRLCEVEVLVVFLVVVDTGAPVGVDVVADVNVAGGGSGVRGSRYRFARHSSSGVSSS